MRNTSQDVPVIVLTLAIIVTILIPFRIIGYGYLPPDDALRHAAKAIAEKDWNEILVLRPGVTMDSHPGWHAILGVVHRLTGCGADGLVVFSIAFLFILFFLIPFFFLKRPEAWLTTIAITILTCTFFQRFLLGRPYIFTMSTLLIMLFLWPKFETRRMDIAAFALLTFLIALSVWIHCLWYMFILPPVCFFLARKRRAAVNISIAVVTGIIAGAIFTGHPAQFFQQTLSHLFYSLSTPKIARLAVGELQPGAGDVLVAMTVLGMIGWRLLHKQRKAGLFNDPVFILALAGWILGFAVERIWLDWGLPATLVWMALELEDSFERTLGELSWKRVAVTCVAGAIIFMAGTSDIGDRWTSNLSRSYLSLNDREEAPWLPEPGGILYSANMEIFYQTFYKNPHAPWRYILGFEPSLMPEEDLAVFQKIRWNFGADEAYEPWVKKMRPEDRLVIRGAGKEKPKISGLEWNYTATGIWIGRLPRK